MDFTVLLSSTGTVITGGQSVTSTSSEVGTAAQDNTANQSGGIGMGWIAIYVVLFGGYLFYLSRSNKKKEQKVDEMRKGLKVGDSVCTNNGMYGKIADIGEDVFIIEFGTNKGIRIPVAKDAIIASKEPVMVAPKNTEE